MIKLYLSLDTFLLGSTLTGGTPLGSVKFGDIFDVALYLTRGGVVQDLGSFDPQIAFGLRAVGSPTQLTNALSFVKQSDLGYLGVIGFDTVALDGAMASGESVDCYGEFRVTLPAGEAVRTLNWAVRVYRQVVVDGMTGPASPALTYPVPTALELVAHKDVAGGYAGLDSGGKVALSRLPAGAELVSRKGAALGYAGLDGTGKVPAAQLPAATVGGDMLASNFAAGATSSTHPVDRSLKSDSTAWAGIPDKPTTFAPDTTAELVSRKGAANGYAPLGSDAKVSSTYLPSLPEAGPAAVGTVTVSTTSDWWSPDPLLSAFTVDSPEAFVAGVRYWAGTHGSFHCTAAPNPIDDHQISIAIQTGDTYKTLGYAKAGTGLFLTDPTGTLESLGRRGVALGYASLDSGGKIPSALLPTAGALPSTHNAFDVLVSDPSNTPTFVHPPSPGLFQSLPTPDLVCRDGAVTPASGGNVTVRVDSSAAVADSFPLFLIDRSVDPYACLGTLTVLSVVDGSHVILHNYGGCPAGLNLDNSLGNVVLYYYDPIGRATALMESDKVQGGAPLGAVDKVWGRNGSGHQGLFALPGGGLPAVTFPEQYQALVTHADGTPAFRTMKSPGLVTSVTSEAVVASTPAAVSPAEDTTGDFTGAGTTVSLTLSATASLILFTDYFIGWENWGILGKMRVWSIDGPTTATFKNVGQIAPGVDLTGAHVYRIDPTGRADALREDSTLTALSVVWARDADGNQGMFAPAMRAAQNLTAVATKVWAMDASGNQGWANLDGSVIA